MSTLLAPAVEVPADATETVADLLDRLGNVPADRVRLHPAPGTATEADVIAIEAKEDRLFELVDGVLVEKSMGFRESYVAMRLIMLLGPWVLARKLGVIVGEAGMMRLLGRQVRIPDVSFISYNKLPDGLVQSIAIPDITPDLAVEVLSKSNTTAEMERKRGEYFGAGTAVVWEVDLDKRSVRVFTSVQEFREVAEWEQLEGGNVLPGLSIKVGELFEGMAK